MKKLLTILFAFALGLNLSAQVPDYVPSDGLVAWYPLDGDLTNEVNLDESSLLIGGSFVPGQANDAEGALSFSANSWAEIHPLIGTTETLTVHLWINEGTNPPNEIQTALYLGQEGFLGDTTTSLDISRDRVNFPGNGRLRSNLNYDFGHVGFDELDGGWVHVLTVFDSGVLSIYRNGLLQQSTTASVSGISINGTSTLGAGHVGTNSEPFNFCHCALDNIGIWNRALTEEEILALYNAPAPAPGCTDPAACNFDAEATSDDGSCIPSGCMDSEACNYDALAECEGEACDYTCCPGPGCCSAGMYWDYDLEQCLNYETCQEDLDGDGVIGINDLMELLSSFGTMCEEPETVEFTCGDPMNYHGYDYATVQIGEQCWFAENLRSELYQNGDAIAGQLTVADWTTTEEGASAVYGESDDCVNHSPLIDACDSAQALIEYGRLYNGYAVIDSRGLCPVDWSIPNNSSWQSLITLAGGASVAGGFLKAETGWSGSGSGINSFGFAGKPGGDRNINGDFVESGHDGDWWTSSSNGTSVLVWEMYHLNSSINQLNGPLASGFSVRCLKD